MSKDLVQVILWLVVFGLLAAGVWAMMREGASRSKRTAHEFERDVERSRGSLVQAAAMGLQKVLSDEKRAAIEYTQDEERGTTRTGSKGGDRDRTAQD